MRLKGGIDGARGSGVLGTSDTWGEGTKMVFLTSLRPRFAVGFRGVATCCACYDNVNKAALQDDIGRLTARNLLATLDSAD